MDIAPPISPTSAMQLLATVRQCETEYKNERVVPAIVITQELIDSIGADVPPGFVAGVVLRWPPDRLIVNAYGVPFIATWPDDGEAA